MSGVEAALAFIVEGAVERVFERLMPSLRGPVAREEQADSPILMSVETAALKFGVSEKTLRNWYQHEGLNSYKRGRRVLLDPNDIREFMRRDSNSVSPGKFDADAAAARLAQKRK